MELFFSANWIYATFVSLYLTFWDFHLEIWLCRRWLFKHNIHHAGVRILLSLTDNRFSNSLRSSSLQHNSAGIQNFCFTFGFKSLRFLVHWKTVNCARAILSDEGRCKKWLATVRLYFWLLKFMFCSYSEFRNSVDLTTNSAVQNFCTVWWFIKLLASCLEAFP